MYIVNNGGPKIFLCVKKHMSLAKLSQGRKSSFPFSQAILIDMITKEYALVALFSSFIGD